MRAVFRVKNLYLLVITSILLIVLSSCAKDYAYIKRTKAFYINDNANVLLQSTKYTIYFYENLNLYDDIEYSLISLYFGILEYIYLYVYGYQSYDYYGFIDQYLDNQYTYNDPLPGETKTLIDYLPMWAWIAIIIVFVVIGYKSGIIEILIQFLFRTKSEKSGGGKSIGYWSKR